MLIKVHWKVNQWFVTLINVIFFHPGEIMHFWWKRLMCRWNWTPVKIIGCLRGHQKKKNCCSCYVYLYLNLIIRLKVNVCYFLHFLYQTTPDRPRSESGYPEWSWDRGQVGLSWHLSATRRTGSGSCVQEESAGGCGWQQDWQIPLCVTRPRQCPHLPLLCTTDCPNAQQQTLPCLQNHRPDGARGQL